MGGNLNRVIFSSASDEWSTPKDTYDALDAEFGFNDDPCPLGGKENGLLRSWKSPIFVNPPYSDIKPWMEKALFESKAKKTIVLLVPSRTDTKWFHDYAMKASEIRFIRGRLKFGNAKNNAPFPSCIVIFREANCSPAHSKPKPAHLDTDAMLAEKSDADELAADQEDAK